MGRGHNAPGVPYLLSPMFELFASGRMQGGGVLDVHFEGARIDMIDLSSAEFSLIALLMQSAERAKQHDDWSQAFLTSKALAKLAVRNGAGLTDDRERIPRVAHQIRLRLAERDPRLYTVTEVVPGRDFAHSLLQRHAKLGYRLGLPPENLYLTLIDDEGG